MRTLTMVCLLTVALTVCNAQWVQTSLDSCEVRCLVENGSSLFAGTWLDGVFRSTNNGASWNPVNAGLTQPYIVNALAVSWTNLFAATGAGVFLSTNNGTNWTSVNNGLTQTSVLCLAVMGTSIFAGTCCGGGVFLSTNNGTRWSAVNNGMTYVSDVNCLAVSGTNLLAGWGWLGSGGVYLSADSGLSWVQANTGLPANTTVNSLAVLDTKLLCGPLGAGVFLSTNNGSNWTAVNTGLADTNVSALAVSGTNLFAGTLGGGVFLSTNNGTSWTEVNSGLTNPQVLCLAVTGTNLFAGIEGGGVWRRPLSEMITDVENGQRLPSRFALEQNYPNPFNLGTKIGFQIADYGLMTLKVYDVLGREVATLVNETKQPGTYTVRWDASAVASGMYFYRLSTGSFVSTLKMLLMK